MLRDYQTTLAHQGAEIAKQHSLVYYAIEMRVGKTLISLETSKLLHAKNTLFLTKKKALSSVEADTKREGYENITIINHEQAHKLSPVYDCIIVDEAHVVGAFPKPSQRQKHIKKLCKAAKYVILMSGTPCPESYSQLYHQFDSAPIPVFSHKNFYAWAKEFVTVKQIRLAAGRFANDYSHANEKAILSLTDPYFVRYTQKEAGFSGGEINELIVPIRANLSTYRLADKLLKDHIHTFTTGQSIVCDTPVSLMTKLHQVYSGTVIRDDNSDYIFDISKAEYIKTHYSHKKIAVFYKFKAEEKVLRKFLGNIHDSPETFNAAKTGVYISQIQSGSMGVNLSTADYLIFYNIDFSATSYWQARARIQDLKRKTPAEIHWLFTENGIEQKIMDAVSKKKDYTTTMFKTDYHLRKSYERTANPI